MMIMISVIIIIIIIIIASIIADIIINIITAININSNDTNNYDNDISRGLNNSNIHKHTTIKQEKHSRGFSSTRLILFDFTRNYDFCTLSQ